MKLIVVLLLFFVFSAFGQVRLESPEVVVSKKKNAFIYIQIYKIKNGEKISISRGTGFFVSKQGYAITNKHVFSEYLSNPSGLFVRVSSPRGDIFKNVYLGHCGGKKNIDLCLLQIDDVKAIQVINLISNDVGAGNSVYSFGNCEGDFVLKKGQVKERSIKNFEFLAGTSSQKINIDTETVRTDIKLCPGDSGGALFDVQGEFVGVNTRFTKVGFEDYSIAISSKEVADFFLQAKLKKLIPVPVED